MTKIYVVTKGDYSDYTIHGVYSTEELADEAAVLYSDSSDDAEVETYELDDMPDHVPGQKPWTVRMDKGGNAYSTSRASVDCFDVYNSMCGPSGGTNSWDKSPDAMWFNVWAKDMKHAVKIANERRVQLIATDQWEGTYEERAKRLKEEREGKP